MRICHLSDIHLSSENLTNFRNYYLQGLLTDLKHFHEKIPIDIILVTGDLVDKGGFSLGHDDCYKIFETEFIQPILSTLEITKDQFLFIPGNHDVDRNAIDKGNEFFLAQTLTKEEANKLLLEMNGKFDIATNERIRHFKDFERKFHANTRGYQYSNNESLFAACKRNEKIGFALINDSWRCSSSLQKEQHFIGANQLFNAKQYFQQEATNFNIAVFHHPLEVINADEAEEIGNILKSFDFGLAVFGHTHAHKFETVISTAGGIIKLNGRAAFNNSQEEKSKFQPGYTVIDIDPQDRRCKFHGRKFILSGFRFDKDVDNFTDGYAEIEVVRSKNVPLYDEERKPIADLPSGFSTDVNRIVHLLIGKSLYPSSYSFVRELVQNAVDACNRRKEQDTYSTPQIRINVDTNNRYFEVIDEGDGMSKTVLRENFAVIGKSIAHEQNIASNDKALISQFGIGFISTFVVAQKVVIDTKSNTDDRVRLEIDDVFKEFSYIESIGEEIKETGTTVRVYLKQKFRPDDAIAMTIECCRHIANLSLFVNGNKLELSDSWNTENAAFTWCISKENYELRLAIGDGQRSIIASNAGFLISTDPKPLLPHRFPSIIGGEVNFQPRAIDFDLSRTTIMTTQKSIDFRKELSVSLRALFTDALDKGTSQLKSSIGNYLMHYLTYIDQEQTSFDSTYMNFYTKGEIINILADLLVYDYNGAMISVREIAYKLKQKALDTVYSHVKDLNENEKVIIRYLQGKGNFLFIPSNANATFSGMGTYAVGNSSVLQKLFQYFNIKFIQLNKNNISLIPLPDVDIVTSAPKLYQEIQNIQHSYSVDIRMVPLGYNERAVIKQGKHYVINTDSGAFRTLLRSSVNLSKEIISVYILGLLGLELAAQG
jgi:predicted MPP superfamily phosphohydrolase